MFAFQMFRLHTSCTCWRW